MDIIGKSKLFVGLAVFLVLLSWVLVAVYGLKPGADLRGGAQWQIRFKDNDSIDVVSIEQFFRDEFGIGVLAKSTGEGDLIISFPDINEETHQKFKKALEEKFGSFEEMSFSSIGPVIGKELRRRSFWAIAVVLLGISLYVAWAFRKISKPISSWKYGVITLLTLLHDVSIPVGLFALLGRQSNVEVDTVFIIALLVVLGFSVNDTIVVFDRIRENIILRRDKNVSLKQIINDSVNETMARSINTSLTLIFVLLAILLVGPSTLFYFILVILIGTVFGTYSSIFVASPLLYLWRGKVDR